MNCVLDDAEEIITKKGVKDAPEIRKHIGRIMLKGENIAVICNAGTQSVATGQV